MVCSFWTAGSGFQGTLCQMFFVCQFLWANKRKRNNPKQEKIVVLKSCSSCHKQNLGVPISKSIWRTSFTEYLGGKKLLLVPDSFPVEAFPRQNEKWKSRKIWLRILRNMKHKLIPTLNDEPFLLLLSLPPSTFYFPQREEPREFYSVVLCFKCRVVHLFPVVLLPGSRGKAENADAKQIITLVLSPVVSGLRILPGLAGIRK